MKCDERAVCPDSRDVDETATVWSDPHQNEHPEACIAFGFIALFGVMLGFALGYWWWG